MFRNYLITVERTDKSQATVLIENATNQGDAIQEALATQPVGTRVIDIEITGGLSLL